MRNHPIRGWVPSMPHGIPREDLAGLPLRSGGELVEVQKHQQRDPLPIACAIGMLQRVGGTTVLQVPVADGPMSLRQVRGLEPLLCDLPHAAAEILLHVEDAVGVEEAQPVARQPTKGRASFAGETRSRPEISSLSAVWVSEASRNVRCSEVSAPSAMILRRDRAARSFCRSFRVSAVTGPSLPVAWSGRSGNGSSGDWRCGEHLRIHINNAGLSQHGECLLGGELQVLGVNDGARRAWSRP